METSNEKSISERAMGYGTLLGVTGILTNILYISGLQYPFFSTMFLIMFIANPFIAGYLTMYYRKRECGGSLAFFAAWQFIVIMYICSAILMAIAQSVYFMFMDNGFLVTTLQEQFEILINTEGIDAALKEQMQSTSDLLGSISYKDLVLHILFTNIIFTPFISLIIAIFTARSRKNGYIDPTANEPLNNE